MRFWSWVTRKWCVGASKLARFFHYPKRVHCISLKVVNFATYETWVIKYFHMCSGLKRLNTYVDFKPELSRSRWDFFHGTAIKYQIKNSCFNLQHSFLPAAGLNFSNLSVFFFRKLNFFDYPITLTQYLHWIRIYPWTARASGTELKFKSSYSLTSRSSNVQRCNTSKAQA